MGMGSKVDLLGIKLVTYLTSFTSNIGGCSMNKTGVGVGGMDQDLSKPDPGYPDPPLVVILNVSKYLSNLFSVDLIPFFVRTKNRF